MKAHILRGKDLQIYELVNFISAQAGEKLNQTCNGRDLDTGFLGSQTVKHIFNNNKKV